MVEVDEKYCIVLEFRLSGNITAVLAMNHPSSAPWIKSNMKQHQVYFVDVTSDPYLTTFTDFFQPMLNSQNPMLLSDI